jgi:hypothetical protein
LSSAARSATTNAVARHRNPEEFIERFAAKILATER